MADTTNTPTSEGDGYMRVGNLRALIATLPGDMLIVLSKDGEGNGFSPLADTGDPDTDRYEADSTWSGDLVDTTDPDYEDEPYDGDGVSVLVLWPVN